MFERQIIAQLREWKARENRKPLILRGARQVGKTTAVDMFGKEFSNYLHFNLDLKSDLAVLERDLPLDDLVNLLFAVRGTVRRDGDTLIFIDEIQNSPKVMAMLRYFKEERPDLHIIAAGSLLENTVDVEASFPVGRVDYMALRPCSFREFLTALGNEDLSYFLEHPQESTLMHDRLLSLFNQYTIVGGMPEIVREYAKNRDVLALDHIYESLVQGYMDDVEKYVRKGQLSEVVRFLIEKSWTRAGSIVTLSRFADSEYRSREVGEGFRLLGKAMLAELVYPTTATSAPAIGEEKRMPKLIMCDTGLTNYQAGIRRELIGATDILDVWRGRIAEQVTAQELLALNNKVSQRRCFWVKGKDSAEVDFIWTFDSMVFPIEVKNGHNSHLRSLHTFIDAAPVDVAVRVWSQPFSIDTVRTTIGGKAFKLINLPFYLLCSIEKILASVVG